MKLHSKSETIFKLCEDPPQEVKVFSRTTDWKEMYKINSAQYQN